MQNMTKHEIEINIIKLQTRLIAIEEEAQAKIITTADIKPYAIFEFNDDNDLLIVLPNEYKMNGEEQTYVIAGCWGDIGRLWNANARTASRIVEYLKLCNARKTNKTMIVAEKS